MIKIIIIYSFNIIIKYVNRIGLLGKCFYVVLLSAFLIGCEDRYEIQFQNGDKLNENVLKNVTKIIPKSTGTFLLIDNPNKKDPFFTKRTIALYKKKRLIKFDYFTNSVLKIENDTLICYLHENEEKDSFNYYPIKYYNKFITGQNIVNNSVVTNFRLIDKNNIELTIKKCSTDLYYNYKVKKNVDIEQIKNYDLTEKLIINISECNFKNDLNEIELIHLKENKIHLIKLKLIDEIKTIDIIHKVMQNL